MRRIRAQTKRSGSLRGQATIEFLLIFATTLAVIALITGALLSLKNSVDTQTKQMKEVLETEDAARAAEIASRFDGEVDFKIGYHRVENDRFLVPYKSGIIEIGGLFAENVSHQG